MVGRGLLSIEDAIVGEELCLSVICHQLLKGIAPVDFSDTFFVQIYKVKSLHQVQ